MRTRTIILLGVVLLGALALTGAGMALAWGGASRAGMPWNGNGTPAPMMGGQSGYGPMMGPNGSGPMMGPNGHSPMMGGAGASSTSSATPAVGVMQVRIAGFAYTPTLIKVKAGTTVTWTNEDTAPHTVTFKNGAQGSGVLRQGQSFSYTFTAAGTYDYYCAVHSAMTASVVVTP